ncbi:MAG: phosphotransferase [Acidimicrobiaceae bacterium]|nr:phosphotransferase [Acidimicrobiaceae bacterium]MBT5579417.1 phosphotransferase [Acidimicrobiaceae bacterium]
MRTLEDLTTASIGTALRAAGVVDVDPTRVTVTEIGAGFGLLGTLGRIGLMWPSGVDGPASIVAKLPTTNPENEWIVNHFSYDRREAGVYRDLRPWERASTPICLAQGWDDDAGRGWLLLNDLGALSGGDQLAGASDEETFAMVDALATWHAAWWDDETLADLDWLPDVNHPTVVGYGKIFDQTWETCVTKLSGALDAAILDAAPAARAEFESAIDTFAKGPRTVVHGDARLDNALFDRSLSGVTGAVLLDFQLATRSRGAYDLAFFCAGSLATDDRRRLEPAVLDRYLDRLHTLGITGYSASDLANDYRLGHIINLPNPVSALAVVNPGTERGARFLHRNAVRGITATVDHLG